MSRFGYDAIIETRLGLLATVTVGDGGWVDLPKPILVRAGEGFVAVPEGEPVNWRCEAAKLLVAK